MGVKPAASPLCGSENEKRGAKVGKEREGVKQCSPCNLNSILTCRRKGKKKGGKKVKDRKEREEEKKRG